VIAMIGWALCMWVLSSLILAWVWARLFGERGQ
jgi:hypothetical protein